MYTIIITVALFVIIGVHKALKKNNFKIDFWFDEMDLFLNVLLNSLLGFMIGMLIAFIIPSKTELYTKELNLESTGLNKDINGNFFIFGGYVNNTYNYAVYVRDNNIYRLKLLPYDQTIITYTKNDPSIIITTEKETDAFINNFSLKSCTNKNYELRVPEGSIIKEYKLQ